MIQRICLLLTAGLLLTLNQNIQAQSSNLELNIYLPNDPQQLNPLLNGNPNVEYLQGHLFAKLLEYDHESLELRPQLATNRPKIEEIESGKYAGGMEITYQIRPEAKWDDGKEVLASDYEFTVKALKNPNVKVDEMLRQQFNFITNISIDANNPKQFTIHCKKRYIMGEAVSGNLYVLPEHIYDPKQIMRKFAFIQLNAPNRFGLSENEWIQEFSDEFNDKVENLSKAKLVGCGAYKIKEHQNGKQLVFERKSDWWGQNLDSASHLTTHPQTLNYRIIEDRDAALKATRMGELDIMTGLEAVQHHKLKRETKFTNQYELDTAARFIYYYLGINTKSPKLSDPKVRLAISKMVDRRQIIDILYYGAAKTINTPIHPDKAYYNDKVETVRYDLTEAAKLLRSAGWKDSDKDGFLDKKINGKRSKFSLIYKYNEGDIVRRAIGMMLQDEAKQIGVEVQLYPEDWASFIENAQRKNYDVMCGAWTQNPGWDDLSPMWHSRSDNPNGSNFTGFRSSEVDQILDDLATTLDEEKVVEHYKKVQQLIQKSHAYVFLFVPYQHTAIRKELEHSGTSPLSPGYDIRTFQKK